NPPRLCYNTSIGDLGSPISHEEESMVDTLFEFLTQAREPLIAAWTAQLLAPDRDPAQVQAAATRGFDGFVHSLADPRGEVFHAYIERVIKPWLRAGTPITDLQAGAEALARVVHAHIDATMHDRADRFHLHHQLQSRLRETYAAW